MTRRRYIGPLPLAPRHTGCQVCGSADYALVLMRRELGEGTIVRRLCPEHAQQAALSRRWVGYAPGGAGEAA